MDRDEKMKTAEVQPAFSLDLTKASRVPAPIVWITGLAGVGKTTLALAVHKKLLDEDVHALLIDGDLVRHALDASADLARHDVGMRLHRAWRIAELARIAALQGVPAIVATIGLFHAVQTWNRAGSVPYAEVLMTADIEELKRRKPAVYAPVRDDAGPVVGVDIAPEFPLSPELVLVQRFVESDLPIHAAKVVATWQRMRAHVTPLRPAATSAP